MQSRAILFTAVNTVAIGEITIPEPGPGEVLVETAFSAVSPGTERRCLMGLQAGAPPFPFVPGYALSGRVLRAGTGVSTGVNLEPGARVFCTGTQQLEGAGRLWGGHVAHAVVPVEALRPVPEAVSLEAAALTKLAAIAHHGLRLSRPQAHETVLVVGLGPIGQLSARLHALSGCRVIGVDPVASRRALLEAMGMETATGLEAAKELLPAGTDIVVDATGVVQLLGQAIELARPLPWGDHDQAGARVLVQGSYPDEMRLPYDTVFQREATIMTPRDAQPRDERAVLELMAGGAFRVNDLISGVFAPSEASQVYAGLGGGVLTALFDWSRAE